MDRFGPDVTLNDPAFIHPSAQIYGKVTIERGASVWPNAVIRSEMLEVVIGPFANIQDFCMIHVGDRTGTYVGAHCSITHHTTIHGARIGDNCLIGINATIMDGCEVGENSIVAGGSFLPEGTLIPANSVVMGLPGKVVRSENNWIRSRMNAWLYHTNAKAYAAGQHRAWAGEEGLDAARAEVERLKAEFARVNGDGGASEGGH